MNSQAIRISSTTTICGYPLYHIAVGGDAESNELRGHAKGIVAIGDIATGVIAIGGVAKGFIAVGGLVSHDI